MVNGKPYWFSMAHAAASDSRVWLTKLAPIGLGGGLTSFGLPSPTFITSHIIPFEPTGTSGKSDAKPNWMYEE